MTGDDDGETATDRDKAPPERAEKPRRASGAHRAAAVHSRGAVSKGDRHPKAPSSALMDKHTLTDRERSEMWADYAGNHAGLLAHLTGMGDDKAQDPIPF